MYVLEPETSNHVLSESPTLTAAATRQGVILGTAPYMSPEQARGKTVDKRSDIFSFGAVLYEMLTGRSPFWGEDVSETLAAVIKSEPDWSRLPRELAPEIRRLLRGCRGRQISTDGGWAPVWSPDAKTIYYQNGSTMNDGHRHHLGADPDRGKASSPLRWSHGAQPV